MVKFMWQSFLEGRGCLNGPIELVACLRFKSLDSKPEKSNMDPVSIDFHNCRLFSERLFHLPGSVAVVFSDRSS